MESVGFDKVEYHSLTGGIVALHIGYKYWYLLIFERLNMLKKSFVYLALSSFVLMGTSFDAEAKRMGGSKSMGKQSQGVTQKQQAAPAQAPAAAPATAAKPAAAPAAV